METKNDIYGKPWGFCVTRPSTQRPMLAPAGLELEGIAAGESFYWLPSSRLGMDVPKDTSFGVVLRSVVLNDGTRCFLPGPTFSTFIARAWMAGLEIQIHEKKLSPAKAYSHRFNWFLYQFARRMQPFIRRSFRSRRDLLVARSAQSTEGERDILPWPIDKTGSRRERLPATVEELMSWGRQLASQDGVDRPTAQQMIQNGLLVAAERMPTLSLTKKEILALIRAALFDVGSSSVVIPKKQIVLVRKRLEKALGNHLGDASIELFNKWLWGPSSSVVKQMAKQKKAVGGEIDSDVVRQALVELGWLAHANVARQVETLMIDFRNVIRPQLTQSELQIFNLLYLRNRYFGGLSLVMLAERLEFLGRHLWQLIQDPADIGKRAILYRLLSFYSAMSDIRRAADRRSKQRLQPNQRTSQLHESTQQWKQSKSDTSDNLITEIAEKVCDMLQIQCGCAKPDWAMDGIDFFDDGLVTATMTCSNKGCGFSKRVKFSAADLE
jgi:hypothetical protein